MVWHNNTVLIIYNKVYEPLPARVPSCVPVRVPLSVFRGFLGSGSRCLPLQMHAAPRGSGGKRWHAGKNVGKCGAGGGKLEKNVKKPKKVKKSP